MKTILYILLAYSMNSYSQMTEIAHLSYNLNDEPENGNYRKTIEKNGNIDFYIRGNFFYYYSTSEIQYLPKNELEKLTVNTLSDMIIYRNKLIDDNKTNGIIKFVWDSEVFKKVYVLEKENDSILKYPVIWVDAIECQ